MNYKKAKTSDILLIMDLFSKCIISMKENGLELWNENYPNLEVISNDINTNETYIVKIENQTVAYFTLHNFEPKEYKNVQWRRSESKSLILHRLTVLPDYQNKGIASKILNFVEHLALEQRIEYIKLDVYSANSAINLYKKNNYTECGKIYFSFKELPFYCYEKQINN